MRHKKQFLSHLTALSCIITAGMMANSNSKPILTSHSFFSVHPQFQSMSAELVSGFKADRMHARVDGIQGALQLAVFGGKSTEAQDLAKYFLPFGKSKITASELDGEAYNNREADVIANYFGVLTKDPIVVDTSRNEFQEAGLNFQSQITMEPKQSVFGLGLAYRQSLSPYEDKGWWVSASMPIIRVQNELGFKETIENEGAGKTPEGFVSNMTDAFKGKPVLNFGPKDANNNATYPGGDKVFKYGKIFDNTACDCGGSDAKWGVADIELKLGYEYLREDLFQAEGFVGIVIPTGTRPDAEYIFQPIVGNNKHFGFILGSSACFQAWASQDDEKKFLMSADVASGYLFRNTQKRSFDLVDKQWSRYMWVYPTEDAQPLIDLEPGINYFTRDVKVTPRFFYNHNVTWAIATSTWSAEVGYRFFARAAEEIELCPDWQKGPFIAGITADNPYDNLASHSNANIRLFSRRNITPADQDEQGIKNLDIIQVNPEDLDVRSGAHPCVLTHTFHGAVGYRWDERDYPMFVNAGASYEYSGDNAGLNRWTLWGKGGFSF